MADSDWKGDFLRVEKIIVEFSTKGREGLRGVSATGHFMAAGVWKGVTSRLLDAPNHFG